MARAARWILAKVWGVPGNIHFWWTVGLPGIPSVLAGIIAYAREASWLVLVLVVVGGYIVALGATAVVLPRVLSRRDKVPDQPNNQEPEGPLKVEGDHNVVSFDQKGGQTAREIHNFGPQPRTVSEASANALVAELRLHPGERFSIKMLMGDSDAEQLGRQLEDILCRAGWSVAQKSLNMFVATPVGVVLRVPKETSQVQILGNWLLRTGLQTDGVLDESVEQMEIIVGARG